MTLLTRRTALLVFALVTLTVGTTIWAATPASGPVDPIRVMSYNVRTSGAKDGENAWDKRIAYFAVPIRRFDPTLMGFQEVRENQYEEIKAQFKEYEFSGVARDDGKRKGEWSLIGFRKDRFTAVKSGDFWLSEQPDVPGSKSWDAALTRICSWVRLRENATGRELVYANTHFDHKGVIARREASRVLSVRLSKIAAGVPAILTGDLNVNEDNPAYAMLVRPATAGAIRLIDSYREVHPLRSPEEASFHGFKGGVQGSRIDFIFHTDHFVAVSSDIDRSAIHGRYPSDHYPVMAVLKLK
jgi:endonuclease/exonuclease/phosphatase family metal-dependent hydrolase